MAEEHKAINKIIYAGFPLIDLTQDTVDESTLLSGTIAHNKSGKTITGNYTPPSLKLQDNKIVTPTKQQQIINPDSNYNGLSKVIVEPIPEEYIIPADNLDIFENGKQDVKKYATVNVSVPTTSANLQFSKTVTPTESQQIVTPDQPYDGLAKVTVQRIPKNYVNENLFKFHATTQVSGTYTPTKDLNTFEVKISVGIKAKVFLINNKGAVAPTNTSGNSNGPYFLTSGFFAEDESSNTLINRVTFFYYNGSRWCGGHSGAMINNFNINSSYIVSGVLDSKVYLCKDCTYEWFAWG